MPSPLEKREAIDRAQKEQQIPGDSEKEIEATPDEEVQLRQLLEREKSLKNGVSLEIIEAEKVNRTQLQERTAVVNCKKLE